jgi:hypothetical protein
MARFINVTTTLIGPNNTLLFTMFTASISIVTAAVYRGFDQELRLAADPIN